MPKRFEDTDPEYRAMRSRASLGAYLGAASAGTGSHTGLTRGRAERGPRGAKLGLAASLSLGRC